MEQSPLPSSFHLITVAWFRSSDDLMMATDSLLRLGGCQQNKRVRTANDLHAHGNLALPVETHLRAPVFPPDVRDKSQIRQRAALQDRGELAIYIYAAWQSNWAVS
jgi:hypothetical protein